MPVRLFSPMLFRLWAITLLAIVGLQATIPIAVPLQHSQGSAFNFATADVAVSPQRPEDGGELVIAPQPVEPALPAVEPREIASPGLRIRLASAHPAIGPPAHHIRSWHPSPRAPPLA